MTEYDECRSTVELAMLAPGMAKQHECYQDALQELVDNAVSSIVKDEFYFEDPTNPVKIVITLQRNQDTVRTTIADNGPGIEIEALQEHVFRTGNKDASDGILNNVGWGLKASIAWFERTLSQSDIDSEESFFTLVTQTEEEGPYRVDGPITGGLPISSADHDIWRKGLDIGDHSLAELDHGTRVHVSCSRSQFDDDVWPSAATLSIKAQALREILGVKFRRLLDAHPENTIHIDYIDHANNDQGSFEALPIFPEYVDNEDNPPSEYGEDSFEIEGDEGTYEVEFKRGTLDFEAMASQIAEDHPEMLTTSGRFRTRYRPSQSRQGVDIYANGRVLMTSVFTDLFDLTRNNEYNYYGGELRIYPKDDDLEVPTDNKKTRIDTNSLLWQSLREKLSTEEFQPEGKRYDVDPSNSSGAEETLEGDFSTSDDNESQSEVTISSDSLFTLHQQDSHQLEDFVRGFNGVGENDDLVDVTVTSPPYFDLKDYGYEDEHQVGQGDSYNQYLDELRQIFQQIYNLTKDSGTMWVVANTFNHNGEVVQLPSDIASICQNLSGNRNCSECSSDKQPVPLQIDQFTRSLSCPNCEYTQDSAQHSWLLKDIIIWNKTRALPYSRHGQFRNVFEYILCFSKTEDYEFDLDKVRIADPDEFKQWWVEYPERYHPRGKVPDNIWEYVTPAQGTFGGVDSLDHPAPFPPTLVERILRLTTDENDVVLDPFAGSGTVPAVAEIMDRKPIALELSSKYCEAYEDVKSGISEEFGDTLRSETKDQQRQLSRVIGGLRQVKQVRELLRQYVKSNDLPSTAELDIHTVFQLCRDMDTGNVGSRRFVDSEVYYVMDSDAEEEVMTKLQNNLKHYASTGPCSRYGVNLDIRVLTTDAFLAQAVDESQTQLTEDLFLYENGLHYAYTEEMDLSDWVQQAVGSNKWQQNFAQHECPPILSNVGLRVDNPRRDNEVEFPESHESSLFKMTGAENYSLLQLDQSQETKAD